MTLGRLAIIGNLMIKPHEIDFQVIGLHLGQQNINLKR